MKYRYLTYQELEIVKEDFSDFLYHNGMNTYEWNVIQDQQSKFALKILMEFSDLTFDRVFSEINYLNFKSKDGLIAVQFETFKMNVIQLKSRGENCTKTKNTEYSDLFKDINLQSQFLCSKTSSDYKTERGLVIFDLIEQGYIPADEKLYQQLFQSRLASQN